MNAKFFLMIISFSSVVCVQEIDAYWYCSRRSQGDVVDEGVVAKREDCNCNDGRCDSAIAVSR